MSILAVDTASRRRGLCVVADATGALLRHRALSGRDLDVELPPALAALFGEDVSAVACVTGPGSYTGLRVGIAAAVGIAHARGLQLHGIGALDVVALAAPLGATVIETVADAGRGALYVALLRRDVPSGELQSIEAAHRVEAAGWSPSSDAVAVSFDAVPGTLDAAELAPSALAAAAARALRSSPLPRAGLEPVYLAGDAGHARRPRV